MEVNLAVSFYLFLNDGTGGHPALAMVCLHFLTAYCRSAVVFSSVIVFGCRPTHITTMSGENKRQATSPADKEVELTKRRFTWQDMKISLDSSEFTAMTPPQLELPPAVEKKSDPTPSSQHEPQEDKSLDKGISLDAKVDRLTEKMDSLKGLTEKMDWLVNFIATSKAESDARNELNDQKFTRVEAAYNRMVDNLAQTSDNLASCNQQLTKQALAVSSNEAGISSLQTQVRIQKSSTDEMRSELQDMNSEFKRLKIEIGDVKRSVLDLGADIREWRLIISGISEQKNEDLIDVVLTSINKVLVCAIAASAPQSQAEAPQGAIPTRPQFRKLTVNDIDKVYRIGRMKKNQANPRNICLSLSNTYLRQMIISAKPFMKGMPKNFYIGEDLTNDARAHRSNLKLLAASAKDLGFDTKISGNQLTIGTESFAPNELAAVSTDIKAGSKQEKLVKNGIAFRGDKSVYSNFFPALFRVDDIEYNSVEQYFQNAKAVECGKLTSARKIMNKINPWHIKIIGDRVEVTDEWMKIRMETLYRGIFAKFDQNGPLKRLLLDSVGSELYEATTDLYYACGIGLDSPKWDTADWPGENVTGKILMKVREEFVSEYSLGHSDGDSIRDLLTSDLEDNLPEGMLIDDDPHLATGNLESNNADSPKHAATNNEDWPVVGKRTSDQHGQKSFTDAVKSPGSRDKNVPNMEKSKDGVPHLKRGEPQITTREGSKGSRGRGKKKQNKKKHLQQTQLTSEEKSFLQSKKKKKQ